MMLSLLRSSLIPWVRLLMVLSLLGLAACASGPVAKVTSYQQWPPNAVGATYAIKPAQVSSPALEFSSVAAQVAEAMEATGLIPADQPEQARFDVVIDYGQRSEQVLEQRDVDPFWGGWGVSPYFGGFYGSHWGWHSGIVMAPVRVTVPVPYQRHTLVVTIRDRAAAGAEVYQASAVMLTESEEFIGVLPYLAEAVFDDFPGHHGQVREVRFERKPLGSTAR